MSSATATSRRDDSRRKYLVGLLAIFLFTRMFMVFKSGLPQPADMGLALLFAVFLRPSQFQWTWTYFKPYVFFVLWVAIVNTTWALLRARTSYFFPFSYYIFNICLVTLVATTRYRYRERFDQYIRWAVLFAALYQVGSTLSGGDLTRAETTFNNPNQLGFWAVSMGVIYLMVRRPDQLVLDAITLGALAFVEAATTSRAGVAAFGVLVLIWLYEVSARSRYRYLVVAALVVGAIVGPRFPAVQNYLTKMEVVETIERRFTKDDNLDEVAYRNTDRITKYWQYTFLGAGESDFDRFPATYRIEIHSTPGTIVFSYGIPGCILFGVFIWKLGSGLRMGQIGAMACLFVYSVTHQGMRFSFFWFAISVIASESVAVQVAARKKRALRARARARNVVTAALPTDPSAPPVPGS